MSYYDPNLFGLTPDFEPELYCVVFDIPRSMPPKFAAQVKAQKLKELYDKALDNLELGRPYAITVDFASNTTHVCEDGPGFYDSFKWTLYLAPVRTQIVEVPRIEEPHYKLPATDSLKERAAAAWNYIRGKGVLSV